MTKAQSWRTALMLGTVLSLIAAPGLMAQTAPVGNLFGTVTDTEGEALPGVTVTLTGLGPERTQITDARGQFRFLGLDPGNEYRLKAALDGFGTIEYPNVVIRLNKSTTIPLVLSAAIEETITVTSESPLLDSREIKAGTAVSQVELEKIPTGRDPWSLLTQTPGVLIDKQNVAGNESGQQSSFYYAGAAFAENDFLVDGMQITDMAATGASPTYYDMDQFSEVAITTGGSDVTKVSAGVSVNMVTKRGSNEFRGSARFSKVDAGGFFGHTLEQANPNFSASDLAPGQTSFTAPRTREIVEYGIEAGGAIITDRVWVWGSFGQNDILQNNSGGGADDTFLENTSFKTNLQFTQSNSAVGSWNNGDKEKFGRAASPTRPDPTTWNQRGPSAFTRLEDTHVFSSSFFLTGSLTDDDLGFSLTAKGCINEGGSAAVHGCVGQTAQMWRDATGVWQDNYQSGGAVRPGEEIKLDSSYFFSTGNVNHELKIGGRNRTFESFSTFDNPGQDNFSLNRPVGHSDCRSLLGVGQDAGLGCNRVYFHRGLTPPVEVEYLSAWAQDTMTFNRFTVNFGFRFDDQDGSNLPASVPANPASATVAANGGGGLPAISGGSSPAAWTYSDIVPRMGLTYALGAERDTLLRLSLAQFVEPLDIGDVSYLNTLSDAYAIFGTPNKSGPYTPGDPLFFFFPSGYDPNNPAAVDTSPHRVDPGLNPRKTTEMILGAEHSLLPQLVVGLSLTLRDVEDLRASPNLYQDSRTGAIRIVNASDYVPAGSISGSIPGTSQSYSRQVFQFDPGGFLTNTGGDFMYNDGRGLNHLGVALNITKRLSNRWMLRGFIHFDDTEWDVPSDFNARTNPNRDLGDTDGDIFVVADTVRGTRFLQSSWSTNVNGMYQVAPDRPWGFNVAANIQGREGGAMPYQADFSAIGGASADSVLVVPAGDTFRLDDIWQFDVRIDKDFNLSGPINLTFGLDCFNCANSGVELAREHDIDSGRLNFLEDILAPRIYRLGVRLAWK